jgi:nitrogen-specific signal transduction histidine kinase
VLSHFQMATPATQSERCMLAHDLNNCVSIVVGECELLVNLISNNAEAMERVRIILRTARRMANDLSTRPCSTKS